MNILYGVASEGMGHAIRSKPVIEHLSKNNKVLVLSDRGAFDLLKKYFQAKKIENLYIKYSNEKVSYFRTFLYNFIRFPKIIFKNKSTLLKEVKEFSPDIVISDFDPITAYYASINKIPLIYINNQHIATNTEVTKEGSFLSRNLTNLVINLFSPQANRYFITTFFYPKIKDNKTTLVPPIVREEVIKAKSKEGKHILIYLRKSYNYDFEKIKQDLKGVNERFIVYGLDIEKKEGNITFKKFSDKGIIKDLEECKGIISGAGFTIISEALYLKKPILALPVKKQQEQLLNSVYLKRLGYGDYSFSLNKEVIVNFIKNLQDYQKKVKKYQSEDNKKLFSLLDKEINKYKRK